MTGRRRSHKLVAMLAAIWRHSGGPRRQSIMIRIALPSASGKPWASQAVSNIIRRASFLRELQEVSE
jgi:hypothetical protein